MTSEQVKILLPDEVEMLESLECGVGGDDDHMMAFIERLAEQRGPHPTYRS